MSWFSDIGDFLGSALGYDHAGQDVGDAITSLFSSSGDSKTATSSSSDGKQTGNGNFGGYGSILSGVLTSGAQTLGDIYKGQNSLANEELLNGTWAEKNAQALEIANINADASKAHAAATVKAAEIEAEAQKKQTLINAYNNWMQSRAQGAEQIGKGFAGLTTAAQTPLDLVINRSR